jgi:hypothetical protein
VSNGFNSLSVGLVVVLVSAPPKLPGEWKVAVGEVDTLRLRGMVLSSLIGISWASVMLALLCWFNSCMSCLLRVLQHEEDGDVKVESGPALVDLRVICPARLGRLEIFPADNFFFSYCQPYCLVGGEIGVRPETNTNQPT